MTAPVQCGPASVRRVAFRGDRNRPGRSDVTGAFAPEALRYAGTLGQVHVVSLTAPRAEQRAQIERVIAEVQPDECAFFCHGLSQRIELGYSVREVDRLAAVLAGVGCSRVALHACLTGKHVTKGFAALLRDALVAAGLDCVRVLASQTSGHCSMNPHRRLFTAPAGAAGAWIVEPRSPGWKAWCRRMRDADDPLRWTLLERDVEAIRLTLRPPSDTI